MQFERVQSLNSIPSTDRPSVSGSNTNNGESRMNKRKKDESFRKRSASIPNPTLNQTQEELHSDVPYPPRKKGRQHSPSQHLTRPQHVTPAQSQTRTRPAVPTKSPQQIQIQNDAYEKIYELERSRIIAEKAQAYDKIVGIVNTINPKSTLNDRDKAMRKVQKVVEAVKPDEEIEIFEA